MWKLMLRIPTFNGNLFEDQIEKGEKPEFGKPLKALVVYRASGLHIVLGTQDINDFQKPEIYVERQPNGWVIFLHPLCGSDPSGYIYFHDDGRSFLLKETPLGPTPDIQVLKAGETVPGFHKPE